MIELAHIEAAARTVAGWVRRTPVVPVDGTSLLAKCENLQETGSFKVRGATNALLSLRPERVVTMSSGNHGQAVAHVGRTLGIRVLIMTTTDAAPLKVDAMEALGATVEVWPDRAAADGAAVAAAAEGWTLVPPYDHPLVMAGQGTVGLEIVADVRSPPAVVVPVGGGGLISGVATAVKARSPGTRVIGVEPEDGDDFVRSLDRGEIQAVPTPRTICDGARTLAPGRLTFPVVQARVDQVVSVSDVAVVAAMRLLHRAGLVVEPTGALAMAGALLLGLGEGTVVVLSGRNVAPADYARWVAPTAD